MNLGQETKKQVVQVIYAGIWCERGRSGGKEEKETADLPWQHEKTKEIEKKKGGGGLREPRAKKPRAMRDTFRCNVAPNYPQIQHKAIICHLWASAASFNSLSYSHNAKHALFFWHVLIWWCSTASIPACNVNGNLGETNSMAYSSSLEMQKDQIIFNPGCCPVPTELVLERKE